ncbi:hypothetical protein NMV45_05740 [Pasteurella multocida]|uniref:hypothetical protein n=1 Tax=Pasteurella multocida TaxID=747 RepID=UPI002A530A8E|nr:hypothetical protein [Pasteurella multocida]MDY0487353.1 hypothetical protein [Pasteurella multocida]MDY0594985.1 hypothetical protein [Pasteurella multocida]MDY0664292.1 hypothetical protein [Pasteurella multocida]MDY0666497.1 hypothetical protein [Pasteurella multocida]
MPFVDELTTNTFTYEPYNGFCPDFSAFFDKVKFPSYYTELNPRPVPPIRGSSWYFPDYEYIVVWYDSSFISVFIVACFFNEEDMNRRILDPYDITALI